jgi:hypothetical protein
MNTLGNNNNLRHLTKLAFSAGSICLALAFAFSLMGGVVHAAPLAVTVPGLGAASTFAVLSAAPDFGGAVTCTRSTINGDVGSSGLMAAVVQTKCKINGNIIAPVPDQVVANFLSAYDKYAAIDCTGYLDPAYTGKTLTLSPGVYCSSAQVAFTDTTLILKGGANGVWIFKIGTSGTGYLEGTNFSVVMDSAEQPCNVTWWVAQYATMTTSGFQGTILAGTYITITGLAVTPTTTTFYGNALAKAAVTLTDVTLTGCEASGGGGGNSHNKCNQGVGNGSETCDPGNSNQGDLSRSNDELGGTPGDPGRKGGNGK